MQGVGYRYFTKQAADRLRLNGTVRNLYTGDVEVMVTGEDEVIALLMEELKKGPSYSKVENISIHESEIQDYLKFEIKI